MMLSDFEKTTGKTVIKNLPQTSLFDSYVNQDTFADAIEIKLEKEDNDQSLAKLLTLSEKELEKESEEKEALVIPKSNIGNYVMDREFNMSGGQKTKFNANIEAIKTLRHIQKEGRMATLKEQETLSKYTGWGGLSNAFNSNSSDWSDEYAKLKELLSDDEYKRAKASTLTAYYTNKSVISAIYKALDKFGFTGGNILDPALGTGNFFGFFPFNSENSTLYGAEIDTISGNIAKNLYPQANIEVCGFEETNYADNFFSVAIGNIPFGDIKVFDKIGRAHV